jgi:hypothetical protein
MSMHGDDKVVILNVLKITNVQSSICVPTSSTMPCQLSTYAKYYPCKYYATSPRASSKQLENEGILALNRGLVVGVLASSPVDRGFEPRLGQAKDYEIGMCCFASPLSTQH